MKKSILLAAACFALSTGLKAQTTVHVETFTGSFNGWTTENLSATSPQVWNWGEIGGAGVGAEEFTTGSTGSVYALGHNSQQQHQGHTTLTSPGIATGGASDLWLQFEHLMSTPNDNLEGKVNVSADGTNWTVVANFSEEILPSKAFYDISATAAGSDSVWIQFELESTFDNFWIVDDIVLFVPPALDAVANSLILNSFAPMTSGAGDVSVTNKGSEVITSLEFEVSANGGAAAAQTATGLNIAPGGTEVVTLPTPFVPATSGGYDVTVEITQVNGQMDADPSNNTTMASAIFYDPANVAVRKPLYEIFTSSTCAPCTPGNASFHGIVDPKDQSTFNYIKYQQNFPGAGDPYVTAEAVSRRGYYGINSIPRMEIDGGWDGNAQSFNEALHTAALDVPAVADIAATATVSVENQTVYYNVAVTPKINMPAGAVNLYVAIIEKYTDKNKGNNGETEFHHVMKKMVKGVGGESMDAWTPGATMDFSGSYVFPGSYRLPAGAANQIDITTEHTVEGFDDLAVISWVTFEDSKQVLQSEKAEAQPSSIGELGNLVVNDLRTFPNPATDILNVSFQLAGDASFDVVLTDLMGRKLDVRSSAAKAGEVVADFDVRNLPNGNYMINVEKDGKIVKSTMAIVRH